MSPSINHGINEGQATTVSYPGPSTNMSILSSCLWFRNPNNITDSKFFVYDNSSTFAFGYNGYTSLYAAVMGTHNARCVFQYLNVYLSMRCIHYCHYIP